MKLISKGNKANHETLLSQLNLTTLDKRRDILSLRWVEKCFSNEKTAKLFPLTKKKYTFFHANTQIKKIASYVHATSSKQRS